jgi:hypothetical protein
MILMKLVTCCETDYETFHDYKKKNPSVENNLCYGLTLRGWPSDS